MSFDEVIVGELGNTGNNSQVLKELYEVRPSVVSLSDIIKNIDIKIKRPKFK